MTQTIEAVDVAGLLRPGMTVFVAGGTAEPSGVLAALAKSGDACAGVHFVSVSLPGINDVDFSRFHPTTRSTAFFATKANRETIASGRVEFVPMHYRGIFDFLAKSPAFDMVLAQLPPPADDGAVSLGVAADFLPAVIEKAKCLIGEINRRQPCPIDAPDFPATRLDYAVHCDSPLASLPIAASSKAALALGQRVAELIADGDCLQVGIGAVPDACLAALTEKNDLGIHSGMISDGVMALSQRGVVTGSRKTLDRNRLVTGVCLGTNSLLEWAGVSPSLSLRPVAYTHDPGVIRQIDQFVSINSALQVDLSGQVNAEMIAGQQVSGTGGCVDMMRSAALSRRGRSIIALSATAAHGKVSRIVPAMAFGTAVTALRSDVDIVVTEYGACRLQHLPLQARAEGLIELAAPEFRAELHEQWKELRLA